MKKPWWKRAQLAQDEMCLVGIVILFILAIILLPTFMGDLP
jgi:hypothetical protein